MTRRARCDDAGFTLVELLISITLLGIVLPVIGTAIMIGLKTTDGATTRLAASNDASMTSSFFVTDVQSATSVGISEKVAVASVDTTCPPPAGSTLLVALRDAGANTVAGYATQAAGTTWDVVRYHCTGGLTLASDGVVAVAHNLPSAASASATCGNTETSLGACPSAGGTPRIVHIGITTNDAEADARNATTTPYSYSLEARRRIS